MKLLESSKVLMSLFTISCVEQYAYITIISIVLIFFSGQSIVVHTGAGHDDMLFVNLANAIINGNWLGEYDRLTLSKGVAYPLFIAIAYYLRIPILLLQAIVYIFACFLVSRSPFVSSRLVKFILFSILIFNPTVYFDIRISRDHFYTSITLILVSLIFYMTGVIHKFRLSSNKGNYKTQSFNDFSKKMSILSIFIGVAFSCFWLTREEGIWLLPFLALPFGEVLSLLKQRVTSRKNIVFLTLKVSCSFIIVFSLIYFSIGYLNYYKYNSFVVNDLKSSQFQSAYNSLVRVKAKSWIPYVPVSKDKRDSIYSVSSSFKKLKPYLEGDLLGWAGDNSGGCTLYPHTCGDYAGGWFLWALKDAVHMAGYNTLPEALGFYKSVSLEIKEACSVGKISCDSVNFLTRFDWDTSLNLKLFQTILDSLVELPHFSFLNQTILNRTANDNGDSISLDFVERITHSTAYKPERRFLHESAFTLDLENLQLLDMKIRSSLLNLILKIYDLFFPPVFYFALIIMIFRLIIAVLKLGFSSLLIVNLFLFCIILNRIFILSVIDLTSFPGFQYGYISPCIPILMFFSVMSIYDFFASVKSLRVNLL